jgi:hypothetical protein
MDLADRYGDGEEPRSGSPEPGGQQGARSQRQHTKNREQSMRAFGAVRNSIGDKKSARYRADQEQSKSRPATYEIRKETMHRSPIQRYSDSRPVLEPLWGRNPDSFELSEFDDAALQADGCSVGTVIGIQF